MKQFYSYEYLWQYPKLYNRLEVSEIRNTSAVVDICENILTGIREECENLLKSLKLEPNNEKLIREARKMGQYLVSDTISAISFGGSVSYANEFRSQCPEGVFED